MNRNPNISEQDLAQIRKDFARSGGIARGKSLSKAELSKIGKAGVAARELKRKQRKQQEEQK